MLIVDDSPLIRRVVRDALADTGDLVVVGEAADGLEAIQRVHELNPDLVTLDIDMPAMGGLDALGYIMSECPRPVVVLSGHEPKQGGDLTIRALELGAVDFVRKPSWAEALDVETLCRRLLQALREAALGHVRQLVPTVPPMRDWRVESRGLSETPPRLTRRGPARRVIGVAASTGGPKTLAELIPRLPPDVDAAVVIVQHMPAGFTASLARRLHELGPRPVEEVRHGSVLMSGCVYIAPGGVHTTVGRGDAATVTFRLDDTPAVHGVRPAADLTFRSLAETFGSRAVIVVLTGMGRDGAAGAAAVRSAGGHVLVQDPETCVVSGMGQAVLAAGAADAVLALEDLPEALRRLCAASPGGS
ncbi:MAG: chemotaxis-specific protein-glutamate methyltransferase CheB [Gemmatimonadaceae bacterium]